MLREYKPFGRPGAGAPRREQESYRTKAVHNEQLNEGPEIVSMLFFSLLSYFQFSSELLLICSFCQIPKIALMFLFS